MIKNHLKTNTRSYTYREIYQLFADSTYGKNLAGKVRYDRYQPDSVPGSQWVEILGPDVNNLEHHWVVYNQTLDFIKQAEALELAEKEVELLLLAAVNHDWAEAIVGDVMFDLKPDDFEDKELTAFLRITDELIRPLNDEQLYDFQLNSYSLSLENKTRLGEIFFLIECLGYLETGIRSWQQARRFQKISPELSRNLEWLTNNVVLNQVSFLTSKASDFAPVKTGLEQYRLELDNIFEQMPEDIFSLYEKDELAKNQAKYQKAKEDWEEF